MSRIFMLLQFALVGCRDAGYWKDSFRAFGEFRLAFSARNAIGLSCAEQVDKLKTEVDKYNSSDDDVMKSRGDTYKLVVESIEADQIETKSVLEMKDFRGVFAAIDTGLDRIQQALNASDFCRCEIEADHIHNLPFLIDTTTKKSLDFYLDKERELYLWRLKEHYGVEASAQAEALFREHWNLMLLKAK